MGSNKRGANALDSPLLAITVLDKLLALHVDEAQCGAARIHSNWVYSLHYTHSIHTRPLTLIWNKWVGRSS